MRKIAFITAGTMGVLAACGGGGSTDAACASGSFSVTTTWLVTGGEYNPPRYGDQIVVGRVGTPLSAKPVHGGIPAGCVGQGVYSSGNELPLPPGLSLNPSTGEVSGTPTARSDFSGGGTSTGAVRLSFPGFATVRVLARIAVE